MELKKCNIYIYIYSSVVMPGYTNEKSNNNDNNNKSIYIPDLYLLKDGC